MTWSRQFWLRSAGFPFGRLGDLALHDAMPALRDAEDAAARLAGLDRAIARELAVRHGGEAALRWNDWVARDRPALRNPPQALAEDPVTGPLIRARAEAAAAAASADAAFSEAFGREIPGLRERLAARCLDPLAAEAIYLSNPDALARIRSLEGKDMARLNGRLRQQLRLAWSYLQRLCAKNDTASFFGPIAWGRVDRDRPEALACRPLDPGAGLIEGRRVFFEHWVVAALADAMARDPALAPRLPVSLDPGCAVEDGRLRHPLDRRTALPPPVAAWLGRIAEAGPDGLAPAALAEAAAACGLDGARAARLVETFLAKGVLLRDLRPAPGAPEPLAPLRAFLEDLPDAVPARRTWLDALDRLDALRGDFTEAPLEGRAAIAEEMRERLRGLGIDPSREQGRMYVGRFAVYEDCRRNLDLAMGGPLAARIEAGLAPLLELHRVVAGQAARLLHARWRRVFDALGGTGDAPVDFLAFLAAARRDVDPGAVADELAARLRPAWDGVLAGRADAREIALEAEDFAAVAAALEAQAPPGPAALPVLGPGIASPDVMLAAAGPDAIARGEYLVVVGEVHPAVHTVAQPVALPFCPDPAGIARETEALLAPGRLLLADSARGYQRSHIDWPDTPSLFQIVLPRGRGRTPPERQVPAGRAEIALEDGMLVVRDRLTGRAEDVVTVLSSDLHRVLFAVAGAVAASHVPARLTCRGAIVKRRSWRVDAAPFGAAAAPAEDAADFRALRALAARLGMPRFVFAKSPEEPKPVYVDFDSPLALDLLAKMARSTSELAVSEMRPAPDELWLADGGDRYCAEFRMSATP